MNFRVSLLFKAAKLWLFLLPVGKDWAVSEPATDTFFGKRSTVLLLVYKHFLIFMTEIFRSLLSSCQWYFPAVLCVRHAVGIRDKGERNKPGIVQELCQ